MKKRIAPQEYRNSDWNIWQNDDGTYSYDDIKVALLVDIRDELQALNAKLAGVGPTVHDIERNTRGIRRCRRCGHGPYLTSAGLERHVERVHLRKG